MTFPRFGTIIAALLVLDFGPRLTAGPLSGEKVLGHTLAAHSLTRGHNRKVIYDPVRKNWYAFWLAEVDGSPTVQPGEGMVVQRTTRGVWSPPQTIGFDEAGSTSFDVIGAGGALHALGLETNPLTGLQEDGVRRLDINPDGSLTVGPLGAAFANSGPASSNHFYGSLLRDSLGYIWIAARVGDSTPGTHAEVIRSTGVDTLTAWGPNGCKGGGCNSAWVNPYPTRTLQQGTIANRLLDLKGFGIGLMTYNKKNGEPATIGQILFTLNPTGGHAGWNTNSLLLTDKANQHDGANPDDPTRLDDRRFSAVVDPATGVIHVVYVARDSADATNANLRYFTLSPPYASLADKSAEKVVVPVETDGAQLTIDSRHQPSKVILFFIENHAPNYTMKMLSNPGSGFPVSSTATTISSTVGRRQYPQAPLAVPKKTIIVIDQENTTDGWNIVARGVKLPG